MLPSVADLTGEMVDAARRQRPFEPFKTIADATAEAQRGRCAQRDTNNMLEMRPVAMPAYSCAGIVPGQQCLYECAGLQRCKRLRSIAERCQPFR